MAGVLQQKLIALKAFFVQPKSGEKAQQEGGQEKAVGVQPVGMVEPVVDLIIVENRPHGQDPHGFVHKIIDEKAEDAKGQAAVVQVVAFVPGLCAGKDGRNHKAQQKAEKDG